MELYPEGERIYGGYTLFLKFNADNTVVASSENFAAGKTESSFRQELKSRGRASNINIFFINILFYLISGI